MPRLTVVVVSLMIFPGLLSGCGGSGSSRSLELRAAAVAKRVSGRDVVKVRCVNDKGRVACVAVVRTAGQKCDLWSVYGSPTHLRASRSFEHKPCSISFA